MRGWGTKRVEERRVREWEREGGEKFCRQHAELVRAGITRSQQRTAPSCVDCRARICWYEGKNPILILSMLNIRGFFYIKINNTFYFARNFYKSLSYVAKAEIFLLNVFDKLDCDVEFYKSHRNDEIPNGRTRKFTRKWINLREACGWPWGEVDRAWRKLL